MKSFELGQEWGQLRVGGENEVQSCNRKWGKIQRKDVGKQGDSAIIFWQYNCPPTKSVKKTKVVMNKSSNYKILHVCHIS